MICAFISIVLLWIGHACIWTWLLNNLYGRPINKGFLRTWRLFTGLIILAPIPVIAVVNYYDIKIDQLPKAVLIPFGLFVMCEFLASWFVGFVYFPAITIFRLLRPGFDNGRAHEISSSFLELWPQYGRQLIGKGQWRHVARLPFNDPFTVEFTSLTLAFPPEPMPEMPKYFIGIEENEIDGSDILQELQSDLDPGLPAALEGLTILYLSDFHFYGTPSQVYFDAILREIENQPVPDIVVLGGDYIDSTAYHSWIPPLLSRLKWKEAAFAILGNHDQKYEPEKLRETLAGLGFTVLSNRWQEVSIRGQRVGFVGHEGPWVRPAPALADGPMDCFKIGLSHTPDNFEWASNPYPVDYREKYLPLRRVNLLLCGHTHGGQIRLPIIGSIFVPSIYSRRYDQGVFKKGRTTMVVGRGISGKEPLRFRCPPQVLRIKLTRG